MAIKLDFLCASLHIIIKLSRSAVSLEQFSLCVRVEMLDAISDAC